MIRKLQSNQKGFTLIELMIVVAIIGILAAIAIPQFAQYRIRGYNASAQSDVRNLNTSESALFADWQRFGTTLETAVPFTPALAAGALITGGNTTVDGIATSDPNGTARGVQIPLGNGVSVVAVTNPVLPAAAANTTAFNAASKHRNGDTVFAVDSDSTAVYQNPTLVVTGTPLAVGNVIAAANGADEYLAAAAAGWSAK